jgi:hypothetical protein
MTSLKIRDEDRVPHSFAFCANEWVSRVCPPVEYARHRNLTTIQWANLWIAMLGDDSKLSLPATSNAQNSARAALERDVRFGLV